MINFSEILWRPRTGGRGLSGKNTPTPFESPDSMVPLETKVVQANIKPESRVVLFTDPEGPAADRFRYLRMRFREFQTLSNLRSLVITSALPQEGKSTVTLNLATALAEKGKRRVLVVEADLYRPTATSILGLPEAPGLAECLESGLDPLSAIRRVEPLGWYLLSAGEADSSPAELMHSDTLAGIINRVSSDFQWVLFDTPPVIPLTDALTLAAHVDGTLMVVQANRTPQDAVERALELVGTKHLVGIVLNGADGLAPNYGNYAYYKKK